VNEQIMETGGKTWRIVGINFDHMHMGDLLRMVANHPRAEIAGICDPQPERMSEAAMQFEIPADRIFTRHDACLDAVRPDLVILCPATAEHADWVERSPPVALRSCSRNRSQHHSRRRTGFSVR
jgi:predicted dehydrogenase